jgi:hypothetical protein
VGHLHQAQEETADLEPFNGSRTLTKREIYSKKKMLLKEVWYVIAKHANDHQTWLALLQTCKASRAGVEPLIRAYMHEHVYVQFPLDPGNLDLVSHVVVTTCLDQCKVNTASYSDLSGRGRTFYLRFQYGDGKLLTFAMRRIDLIRFLQGRLHTFTDQLWTPHWV